ncbi:threonine/serine exporter family protein [Fodinisporobacter ferrooxydans]|uniref:Threonine/serine exporter family protein n=1 Tax=Fodinisporobacter ferrooxydans TaxID=2901836 RepID=A0ABY4CPD8_9BACL|nr:threonine/serine exporter family protein [Alicyclobacillaceae bacterium MYW30-H2]
MHIFFMMILSFVATVSFAVLFFVPPKALMPVGLVGVIGWLILVLSLNHNISNVAGSFMAALVIAFLSELLARQFKMPVIVFTVAGIVPLVPGSSAFSTMIDFVNGRYMNGLAKGAETLLIAGAIATGLVISGAFMRFGWRRQHVPTKTPPNNSK